MIANPVVVGGNAAQTHHIYYPDNSGSGWLGIEEVAGLPAEAKAGEYVVSTTGAQRGVLEMYEWENGESGNLVVRVSNVSTVDDLPELAREKLDQVPQVMAPPAETPGYYFFVMPPHDVFIREY